MSIFKKTRKYSIIYSRNVSEMEAVQFTLTSDDINEFADLVQAAADAVQPQADRFQRQLKQAETDNENARAARVEKGKIKNG